MKLTRRMRRAINRKLRPNYTQENLLTFAFQNQVRSQIYEKIRNAKTVEEVDDIINSFDLNTLMPAVNRLTNSLFVRSQKEFDTVLSAFIKDPKESYLKLRHANLLQRHEDYKPFLEMFKHNITLIKDLPKDLSNQLKSAYFTGTAFRGTAFAKELKERLGKRARTIIRTESAKITSSLTQARMQKLGLNAYVWSTSEDSRVRGSHSLLDGVLIFWSDPPTIDNYQNHCGRFVNCRCVPIPVTNVNDIPFPIKVANSVNIQTTWLKGKGKSQSKVVSGAILEYSRETFLRDFGHLFT